MCPLKIEKIRFRCNNEYKLEAKFKKVANPKITINSVLERHAAHFLNPSVDDMNTTKQQNQIASAQSTFIDPNSFQSGNLWRKMFLLLYLQIKRQLHCTTYVQEIVPINSYLLYWFEANWQLFSGTSKPGYWGIQFSSAPLKSQFLHGTP